MSVPEPPLEPGRSARVSGKSGTLVESEERFRLLVDGVTDYAIFMLDPQGFVASWNAGAAKIKGYAADEIIGRHFSVFYPKELIERGWPQEELNLTLRLRRFEDEGWRIRKDGTRFWANVIITALFDDLGRHRGFAKVTRDLSERKRDEETLRQSEERFRLLVDTVQDHAFYLLDPDGKVSSWNDGAARLKGYRAEEILGAHFSRFYPPEELATGKPEADLLLARERGRIDGHGWRVRKDGSRFWAGITVTALFGKGGTLRGFAKVTRDMSDRQRIESLEHSAQRMHEFLAMLAHELRNPLAPIRNAVDILRTRRPGEEKFAETFDWCRDVIDRQATQLTRLVGDLLDVSRITRGTIPLTKSPLDVAQVVARAVETSRPLVEARRHSLEIAAPPSPAWVSADLLRLSQAIVNLLNNAAIYTPEGGHIRVSFARSGREVVLSIRDDGIGIAPEVLPDVFDLFVQGSRAIDRREGGLGIGLTLVRRLVEMHGGSVEARSQGLGRGSEFVVHLPAIEPPSVRAAPAASRTPEMQGARRILVVDDNRDSAEGLALLLKFGGHDVQVAFDGDSAIELAAKQRSSVVFLDLGLPGKDGFVIARQLRELPETAGATIVALTGYGSDEDRKRTREAGFDHHLVKPASHAAIDRIVRESDPEQAARSP